MLLNMKFIIGSSVVDKISGPISMYCLDQCQQDFPFVVLFGDDHSNSMFQCQNCICDSNSENCCLAIFKSEIFDLLEKSSQCTNSKIDIFVESMDKKIDTIDVENFKKYKKIIEPQLSLENEKPSGITKLMYKFRGCFYTLIKKTNTALFHQICEFPTLNWIHNDIRQIDFFSEEKRLESLISNCWSDHLFGVIFYLKVNNFDQSIFNEKVVNSSLLGCFQTKEKLIFFCEVMEKFYNISAFDEFFNTFLNQNIIKSFTGEVIKRHDMQSFIRSFLEIYQNYIYPLLFKRINRYKNNTNPIDELISKDFNKFIEDVKTNFLKLSEFFKEFRVYVQEPTLNNYNILLHKIEWLLSLTNNDEHQYIIKLKSSSLEAGILDLSNVVKFLNCSLKDIHNIHSSFFLDMINLFRVVTSKNKLSIFYCGEEHCKVLNEILLKVFKYQQRVALIPSKDLNRCLNLSEVESLNNPGVFDINIDSILK